MKAQESEIKLYENVEEIEKYENIVTKQERGSYWMVL